MKEQYEGLVECMRDVGFTPEQIESIHSTIACILHIGNVEFTACDSDFAQIENKTPVKTICALLGLEEDELALTLVSDSNLTRGEVVRTNYSVAKAEDNRDAMAKAIYGRLFGWIVNRANVLLSPRGVLYEEARQREGGITEVGILDIFGFENFEHNSFEQFCINVANEQLQFYFNQHIFAWEQQEYIREGGGVELCIGQYCRLTSPLFFSPLPSRPGCRGHLLQGQPARAQHGAWQATWPLCPSGRGDALPKVRRPLSGLCSFCSFCSC